MILIEDIPAWRLFIRAACRAKEPLQVETSPVFGGWEVPSGRAVSGDRRRTPPSARRAAETLVQRASAGSFTNNRKFETSGQGTEAYLNPVMNCIC